MATLKQTAKDLEKQLRVYFKDKAPALPDSAKELIVEWLWLLIVISLVGMGFSVLMMLVALFGVGAMMPMRMIWGGGWLWLGSGIMLIGMVITAMILWRALPLVKARKKEGWELLYYALLVSLVVDVLSFNIGGLIIGGLIGFYLLFQIQELYK